jgi:hypothetical protein
MRLQINLYAKISYSQNEKNIWHIHYLCPHVRFVFDLVSRPRATLRVCLLEYAPILAIAGVGLGCR